MAGGTIAAQTAFVAVILGMAGNAIAGGVFKDGLLMAVFTVQAGVLSGQFESKLAVVEWTRRPVIGGVTLATLRAEIAIMSIFLRMAGNAVVGRVGKDALDMAALTGQSSVFAGQLESKLIVIKGGRSPVVGGVTVAAQAAKIALMNVFPGVAGNTVAGCAL